MALDSMDFGQQNNFYSKLLRLKVCIAQYLFPNGKADNLPLVHIAQSLIFKFHDVSTLDETFLFMSFEECWV